jgi:hypothetical protein
MGRIVNNDYVDHTTDFKSECNDKLANDNNTDDEIYLFFGGGKNHYVKKK